MKQQTNGKTKKSHRRETVTPKGERDIAEVLNARDTTDAASPTQAIDPNTSNDSLVVTDDVVVRHCRQVALAHMWTDAQRALAPVACGELAEDGAAPRPISEAMMAKGPVDLLQFFLVDHALCVHADADSVVIEPPTQVFEDYVGLRGRCGRCGVTKDLSALDVRETRMEPHEWWARLGMGMLARPANRPTFLTAELLPTPAFLRCMATIEVLLAQMILLCSADPDAVH